MELIYKKDALHAVLHNQGDAAVAAVQNIKAVDAVPVVRCGECNRHEELRDTCLKAFIWCNFYNTHKFKDGYCNCGERKDGERRTE